MAQEIDWVTKKQDWVRVVKTLCGTIERWAERQGWTVSSEEKTVEEQGLGRYTVPALLIHTPTTTVRIDPVGRNIIGAEGRVDITSFPTMNRMLLVRVDGKWHLKTESRVDWPKPWNERTFVALVKNLGAAA